jgi:hypothetical protein
MRIAAVGRVFPEHYYDQKTLVDAFERTIEGMRQVIALCDEAKEGEPPAS